MVWHFLFKKDAELIQFWTNLQKCIARFPQIVSKDLPKVQISPIYPKLLYDSVINLLFFLQKKKEPIMTEQDNIQEISISTDFTGQQKTR